jgi:hypothetical protein
MRDATPVPTTAPCDPDIDENGVDLAQVRAMLDLTPAERLSRMTAFIDSLLATRAADGKPRSR